MSRIHIALVTGRLEANLIPILQLKPEHVCLVASQRMLKNGLRLEKLLKEQLPKANIELRQGLPDTDPESIGQFAMELAEKLDERRAAEPDLTITYDMTGGSKLMGLIFQEAMRLCDAEILYTDSDAGSIYKLGNDLKPGSFRTLPIQPVLNSTIYLQANGKRLRRALSKSASWQDALESRKAVTKHLGRHADSLEGFFGTLNYLIMKGGDGKPPVISQGNRQTPDTLNQQGWEQTINHNPSKPWRDALAQLSDAGLVEWSPSSARRVGFPNLEGAQYLSGGWIEEYAWHCARDAGLDDVHCGVEVTDESDRKADIRNEFDLLAVHNNRMLIIECKTSRLESGSDQDALHKLHSLADQSSGLFGTKVLLSARPFGSQSQRGKNAKRASSMGVQVLDGAEIKSLPEKIRNWMESGYWPN